MKANSGQVGHRTANLSPGRGLPSHLRASKLVDVGGV